MTPPRADLIAPRLPEAAIAPAAEIFVAIAQIQRTLDTIIRRRQALRLMVLSDSPGRIQ